MSRIVSGNITIENLDRVIDRLSNAPKDVGKAAQVALRAGMSAVRRDISKSTPSRFRKLVTSSAKRSKEGLLSGRAGLFTSRRQMFDWFKAYWKNYGTLTHRASGHKFGYPIKPKGSSVGRRRRNDAGQRAELFFDSAIENWQTRFFQVFKDSMKKQGYPLK